MSNVDGAHEVVVILNPHANWNKAGRVAQGVEQALHGRGVPFTTQTTREPNHAIALAKAAVQQGARVVVAAGGDGTVSEVINGLARAGEAAANVALAIFPMGTGNDFAEMVGAPLDIQGASARIATYLASDSGGRRVDIAHAQIETQDGQQLTRYIGNNMGIGLEARVTVESHRAKYLPGSLVYMVGALRAIIRYDTAHMCIAWENAAGEPRCHEDDTLMVSVGNSPRTGGDFYVTRDAVMDDGLLDLGISTAHLSRPQLIRMMVRTLRNQPLDPSQMRIERCRRFTLTCPGGTSIHVDGEMLTECGTQVAVELLPGHLLVLADACT